MGFKAYLAMTGRGISGAHTAGGRAVHYTLVSLKLLAHIMRIAQLNRPSGAAPKGGTPGSFSLLAIGGGPHGAYCPVRMPYQRRGLALLIWHRPIRGNDMTKRYHTLVVRDNGKWLPQFGDYELEAVRDERDSWLYADGYKRADVRIITTGDGQADINAAIAALNGGQ